MHSVLLYGSETWPLRAEDIRCSGINKIKWEETISKTDIRQTAWGLMNMSVTKLGHVLRMPDDCFPRWAVFAEPKSGWERHSGDSSTTWQRNMKSLTEGLSRVGNLRLAGWVPRDSFIFGFKLWVIQHVSAVSGVLVLSLLTFSLRQLDCSFTFGFLSLISSVTLFTSRGVAGMPTRTIEFTLN